MLNTKGLAFASIGALAAAAIWTALVMLTGWNLWILAPVIGGAAGFGMMRATQMRGGVAPGLAAAAIAVAAIFGARYAIVSRWVDARTEEEAIDHLSEQVAQDLEQHDGDAYNDAGEYKAEVKTKARHLWAATSETERAALINALHAQDGASPGGVKLAFDFGLFGLVCTGLAAMAAFKSASMTLDRALVDKGMAGDADAAGVATRMRTANAVPNPGWRLPAHEQAATHAPSASKDNRSAA